MTTRPFFKIRVAAMLVFSCLSLASIAQNVAITDQDGYSPDANTMLDVYSINKGMLVPRVALISTTSPISGTKVSGLLVWNTSTTGTYNKVGFYFWNGTNWEMVGSSNTFSNGLTQTGNTIKLGGALVENTTITQGNYSLTYNLGGSGGTNYNLSSTSGVVFNLAGSGDFNIQDNGVSSFFAGDNGYIGIGNTSPAQKLDVAGNVKIGDNLMVEGSAAYKVYRNLATYSTNTSTSGAIVINTNQPITPDCDFVIKVTGYFLTSAGSYDLTIKGKIASSSFSNTGYVSLGPDNLRVRLGFNGSNLVLIIGETATSYSNPKFTVTHFYQGMTTTNEAYADGWTISQQTSITSYTGVVDVTRANTIDLSDYYDKTYIDNMQNTVQLWNRTSTNTYLKNTNDKVGIGTSTPSNILHIQSTNANVAGTDGSLLDIQNGSTTINTMSGLRFTTNSVNYPKAGIFFQRKTATYGLGSLIFATNHASSNTNVTAADADMIIDYKGNVGIGIGNTDPTGRLTVKGNYSGLVDDPLFEVKNNAGQTVFAVYNEGVRVYVDTTSGKGTGSRGGFAVGGYSSGKVVGQEYLRVTPDSVRVYIDETLNKTTGSRGGFAVGGFSTGKAGSTDLMRLNKNNYFIGHNSGVNSTGLNNLFLGYEAGKENVAGTFNTFMGYNAGLSNISGLNNIFIGYQTGYTNYDGQDNVFIGNQAGYLNYGGNSHTWAGDDNVFIGNKAGYANQFGFRNAYVGYYAGKTNTGFYNVMLGSEAGANSTSSFNVIIGTNAGNNSIADGNTYIGLGSGKFNTTGTQNVFLGGRSGFWTTGGSNNVIIGYGAGEIASGQTLGSDNIIIGYDAGSTQANISDKLIIENSNSTTPLIDGDFFNDLLTINGNLGVNVAANTSYGVYVDLNDTPGSGTAVYGVGGNTGIQGAATVSGTGSRYGIYGTGWYGTSSNYGVYGYGYGGTTAYGVYGKALGATTNWAGYFVGDIRCTGTYNPSDVRMKKNINTISGAIGKLNKIRGVYYEWDNSAIDNLRNSTNQLQNENSESKDEVALNESSFKFPDGQQVGVLAQEVEEILPEAVKMDVNGIKIVDYTKLIPLLIEAIKEQQKQIDELKTQINNK